MDWGGGAVLSHVWPQGRKTPIAFAPHTLSNTEQNNSQIEKEAQGTGTIPFREPLHTGDGSPPVGVYPQSGRATGSYCSMTSEVCCNTV